MDGVGLEPVEQQGPGRGVTEGAAQVVALGEVGDGGQAVTERLGIGFGRGQAVDEVLPRRQEPVPDHRRRRPPVPGAIPRGRGRYSSANSNPHSGMGCRVTLAGGRYWIR